MAASTSYLFVYGTLLNRQNEFGAYLQANCTFYADGKFKGRLYDIGEYPGAVLDESSNIYVYGKVFSLNNTNEVLIQLDAYEGYGPDEEQPNLFVRKMVSVETTGEILDCWVYLYNLPINNLLTIPNGKYLK